MKGMVACSLTSLMQCYNRFWVFLYSLKFYYWFCLLDCHFLSIDAGCDGCHAWGRQRLLNPEHLVVLSAGPIPHNSKHLLIITTDFVALYWFYWICRFHYHLISCRCWVCRSFILFFWGHNEYKIVFFYFQLWNESRYLYGGAIII